MKGNKGYVLDKGFLGLVNGDCELFSDEKEYDEYLKNIRENHKLPKSYQEKKWFPMRASEVFRSLYGYKHVSISRLYMKTILRLRKGLEVMVKTVVLKKTSSKRSRYLRESQPMMMIFVP